MNGGDCKTRAEKKTPSVFLFLFNPEEDYNLLVLREHALGTSDMVYHEGGQGSADAHSFARIFYNFAQNTNDFLMAPKTLPHQLLDILVAEMNMFHLKGIGKTL